MHAPLSHIGWQCPRRILRRLLFSLLFCRRMQVSLLVLCSIPSPCQVPENGLFRLVHRDRELCYSPQFSVSGGKWIFRASWRRRTTGNFRTFCACLRIEFISGPSLAFSVFPSLRQDTDISVSAKVFRALTETENYRQVPLCSVMTLLISLTVGVFRVLRLSAFPPSPTEPSALPLLAISFAEKHGDFTACL